MIAWESMDAGTKSAVGQLLRQHPDYERWQARAHGGDPELTAFLEASTWPDDIRKDRRFYTTGREEPTATLPGFPDMERRLHWHYVDRPVNPGAGTGPAAGVIDRQLAVLARIVGDRQATMAERAYALPWLIHLVGDAHQPLHAASRYGPDGQSDNGGNLVSIVNPFAARYTSMSLHRYWDDLPGPPWLRDGRLASAARSLPHFTGRRPHQELPSSGLTKAGGLPASVSIRPGMTPCRRSAPPSMRTRWRSPVAASPRRVIGSPISCSGCCTPGRGERTKTTASGQVWFHVEHPPPRL